MDTIPAVPPPPQKTRVKKFLNFSSWFVLVTLLPVTVLIFLSQDSGPGDLFYPVKKSLENVVLAAASVNPAAKAAFRTDLTGVRFAEATKLISRKSDAQALADFIAEMELTKEAIASVVNEKEKEKLTNNLIVKIDEYQTRLATIQTQVQENSPPQIPTPTPTSLPTSFPTSIPSPLVSIPQNPSSTPTEIPAPTTFNAPTSPPSTTRVPFPTLVQTKTPSPTKIPTPTILADPTLTFAPTRIPTSIPSSSPSITISPTTIPSPTLPPTLIPPPTGNVGTAIDDTQKKLKEIKNELEKSEEKKKNRHIQK